MAPIILIDKRYGIHTLTKYHRSSHCR